MRKYIHKKVLAFKYHFLTLVLMFVIVNSLRIIHVTSGPRNVGLVSSRREIINDAETYSNSNQERIQIQPRFEEREGQDFRVNDTSGHMILDSTLQAELYGNKTLHEIRQMKKIPFLPDYDNPCFTENGTLHCLPYFFVAGFPKCGTTDMYARMTSHQHIGTHHAKEIHWLYEACGNTERNRATKKDYFAFSTYLSRFDERIGDIESSVYTDNQGRVRHPYILGDFSPSTAWNSPHYAATGENSLDCIRDLLPASRVIIMLRDPVERLYSDYVYTRPKRTTKSGQKKSSGSPEDFNAKVDKAISSWQKCLKTGNEEKCVFKDFMKHPPPSLPGFGVCLYYFYIKRWLEKYPLHLIHIVQFEEYTENPNDYISNIILPFLKRDPYSEASVERLGNLTLSNKGPDFPDMLNKTRTKLYNFFQPFNMKLSELLQDTKFLWDPS